MPDNKSLIVPELFNQHHLEKHLVSLITHIDSINSIEKSKSPLKELRRASMHILTQIWATNSFSKYFQEHSDIVSLTEDPFSLLNNDDLGQISSLEN